MHRAIQYEQQYRQLLTAPDGDTGHSARRRLSASFAAAQLDMPGVAGYYPSLYPLGHRDSITTSMDSLELVAEEGAPSDQAMPQEDQGQTGRQRPKGGTEASAETVEAEDCATTDTDPLQKSSDSVFVEGVGVPGEANGQPHMTSSPSGLKLEQPFPADATPPTPPKLHPVTSCTNGGARGRSHSAVVIGNGSGVDVTGLRFGRAGMVRGGSLQSCSPSAFTGSTGRVSTSTGPLSPLVRKSRTASGNVRKCLLCMFGTCTYTCIPVAVHVSAV